MPVFHGKEQPLSRARPLVLAHRGASGHAPENSLAAFELASQMGADGIELDVHGTRDGVLVVHHDPDLPGLGRIGDLTEREVRSVQLPNGEPIPTLAQALASAPTLQMWIEVKALPDALDAVLLAAIDADPAAERCGVHSFDHRLVKRLARARPGLRLGALTSAYLLDPAATLEATGAQALWQEWQLVDRGLVEVVHQAGGEIIAWTVNDRDRAGELAELGVDGLCGNYPERLRAGA